jgi:hypothetical protein
VVSAQKVFSGEMNVQATRIPNVMNSWYVAVSVPRIRAGAVSA